MRPLATQAGCAPHRAARTMPLVLALLLTCAALPAGPAGPAPLAAQQPGDTVRVVAGPGYEPNHWLHERFLGTGYRDLWTTPIRVPVLDLDRYAGGLELDKLGGGLQSHVLHFTGADGRDYVFRSVDKDSDLGNQPALRDTWTANIIDDLVGSLNPGSALIAAPLLEAAGVLHAEPMLVVMPDDARLGEHRETFAGMLGMIEERPNEVGDGEPGFAGSRRVVATATLLERLEEQGPEHRVDARAYLAARLMDLYLGDWDRHHDQWRWARTPAPGGGYLWQPIPRDRDYALADYDGWFMRVGRNFYRKAVRFTPEIRFVQGLSLSARDLDRELLAELPRAVYDSTAAALQARLTDRAIEEAVRRLPEPWYAARGSELTQLLQARRATLPRAARELYELVAPVVLVRGTDEDERAVVERLPDGSVDVRLYRAGADLPYFQRRVEGDATDEVRVWLHGGDDHAIVRGVTEQSPVVRVIGGGGDDLLVDSSRVAGRRGRRTVLYDARGDNRFDVGPGTRVDRAEYEDQSEPPRGLASERQPDHGATWTVAPWLDYRGSVGLILGGGPVYTRHGFRTEPYRLRLSAGAAVAIPDGGLALSLTGDLPRRDALGLRARLFASQIETFRFYGFGNQPLEGQSSDFYEVMQDEVLLEAEVYDELANGLEWYAGPLAKWTDGEGEPGSPFEQLQPLDGGYAQLGAQAGLRLDRRNDELIPSTGWLLSSGAAAYPPVWDVDETFTRGALELRAYLPVALGTDATLATRVGGVRVWGEYPVHEAAFLGGSRNLRGYPYQRFAGESMLYGSVELRAPLFPADLRLLRGDIGGILLADAGRVFGSQTESDAWHTAAGLGAWFRFEIRGQAYAANAVYAYGSEHRVYAGFGLPF